MADKTDAEKRGVFDALHNPARPIYHVAHARRANTSEEYNSDVIRARAADMLGSNIEAADDVFKLFSERAKKS